MARTNTDEAGGLHLDITAAVPWYRKEFADPVNDLNLVTLTGATWRGIAYDTLILPSGALGLIATCESFKRRCSHHGVNSADTAAALCALVESLNRVAEDSAEEAGVARLIAPAPLGDNHVATIRFA